MNQKIPFSRRNCLVFTLFLTRDGISLVAFLSLFQFCRHSHPRRSFVIILLLLLFVGVASQNQKYEIK
jgi:hypothetical protein